jgi:hypothetical protein
MVARAAAGPGLLKVMFPDDDPHITYPATEEEEFEEEEREDADNIPWTFGHFSEFFIHKAVEAGILTEQGEQKWLAFLCPDVDFGSQEEGTDYPRAMDDLHVPYSR